MQFSDLSETKRNRSTVKGRVRYRVGAWQHGEALGVCQRRNRGDGRENAVRIEGCARMDQAKVLLHEAGTWDEVEGCWPSPATALRESRRVLAQRHSTAQPAVPGKEIASFYKSEGLKCQRDCQEKQGFQVEITRGSSRSKSGRSKTLPFAMATRFPSASPPTGTTSLLQGSAAWLNATLMPHQCRAPPKTWLSCWAPPTRLEACAAKPASYTCAHIHRSFPSFPGLHLIFYFFLYLAQETSVRGEGGFKGA